MVIITPQEEIDAYFDSDRLSQSTLKKLEAGLKSFLDNQQDKRELYYEEKSYFLIGSAVDTILTGEEPEFKKQYHVSTLMKKPSETEMSILNQVFDEFKDHIDDPEILKTVELEGAEEMLLMAANDHQWQMKWKTETRITKLIEKGLSYFNELKESVGKQILTIEQYELIQNIVKSLRSNLQTGKYFDREAQENMETVDFYYQLPIYFEIDGIECKALLDLVIVVKDSEGKIQFIEPVDLKTMSGQTLNFLNNVKRHRYDIQAAWYTKALESKFPNADIKPFTFIVESSSGYNMPLVYKLHESLMKIGKLGRSAIKLVDTNFTFSEDVKDYNIVREIRGYESLLEDYKYYQENGWEVDKLIVENPEYLTLNWENIM